MSTLQPLCRPPFMDSLTCRNLRSACLEERHTVRHFLHCAEAMEAASLPVVAHAFRFAAAQDREHAAVLSGLIASHGSAAPDADESPDAITRDPVELLRGAARRKHGIWDVLYPQYARAAREEGYPRIAKTLDRMAETEQIHARRFAQYLESLNAGTLFCAPQRCTWLCLHCGQLHTGFEPPDACPLCSGGRGHFIRSDFYPFSVADL